MTDAVFFDLFETLVTEFDPAGPAPSIAVRLGWPQEAFRREWRACRRERWTGELADYPTALRHVAAKLGLPLSDADIERQRRERLRRKAAALNAAQEPVLEVLASLRDRGACLGIISNCEPEEVAAWPECPLAPLMDVVVFSCEVGCAKPDASIYRLACGRDGVAPDGRPFVCYGADELAGSAAVGMAPYAATWYRRQYGGDTEPMPYPVLANIADVLGLAGGR